MNGINSAHMRSPLRIPRLWRLLLAMAALVFGVQMLLVAWQLSCTPVNAGGSASDSEIRHPQGLRIQIVQQGAFFLHENHEPHEFRAGLQPTDTTSTASDKKSATLNKLTDQRPPLNTEHTETRLKPAAIPSSTREMAERLKSFKLPAGAEVAADKSLNTWIGGVTKLCGGAFEGYANEFAVLHDVVVNPSLATSKRVGGEPIHNVLNQVERDEYFALQYGFFNLDGACHDADVVPSKRTLQYTFNRKNHLKDYLEALDPGLVLSARPAEAVTIWSRTAVMLTRNDFANLFQTTAEWYNVFLMMLLFQLHQDDLDIILLDAHPASILDIPWRTLWPHIYRFGNRSMFSGPIRFTNLIWLEQGFSSPLNTYAWRRFPFLEHFRHFLLSRHNVSSETPVQSNTTACLMDEVPLRGTTSCAVKPAHCAAPTVLLLLRKDYMSHPRNPTGHISRKLTNEYAVLRALRKAAPGARVERFVPTEMSMREQMERVARADVLLGIHGAGHTLGLFLPPHGCDFLAKLKAMRIQLLDEL